MFLFLFEYVIRLIAAQHPFAFLIGVWSIVDLLTIAPLLFFAFLNEDFNDQDNVFRKMLNITRILRLLRVVHYINKNYKPGDSEFSGVSKQIYIIFLTILTLIMVTAGILYAF